MKETEKLSRYVRRKATCVGIDFGDTCAQKGTVRSSVVVGLLVTGLLASVAICKVKKNGSRVLDEIRQRTNPRAPVAENIYPEPEELDPLHPIVLMLEALNNSIKSQKYKSFIQLALPLKPLFECVDLSEQESIFDKIEEEGIVVKIEQLIESAKKKNNQSLLIDNLTQLSKFSALANESSPSEIIILTANQSLLERACKTEIAENDPGFSENFTQFAVLVLNNQTIILKL